MKLVLTSGGISNKSIENELRTIIGKDFKGLKMLFCTTASNYEGGDMNELTFYGYEAPAKTSWDADKSGRLDGFDLALMRQMLIEKDGTYRTSDLIGLSRFLLNR